MARVPSCAAAPFHHCWCCPPFCPHSICNVLPCLPVDDVLALLAAGAKHRHTAATRVNAESSRSHCVFTCTLVSETREEGGVVTRTSQVGQQKYTGRAALVANALRRVLIQTPTDSQLI